MTAALTEKEKITQRVSDFTQTFSGTQGKRVLEYLSIFCLKKECTFDKDSARKSIFNSGARAVILEIDYWREYDLSILDKTDETENTEPEKGGQDE